MDSVYGPAVDCRGNVYVGDANNARIEKFGEPGAGDPPSCPIASSNPGDGAVIDKTPPSESLSFKKKQRLKKLSVTVKINEASSVEAGGSVNVTGASKRLKFKSVKRDVAANASTTLALKLSKGNYRKAARALARGKKLTAKLTIKATDTAKNASTTKASIKLKR